MKIIIQLIFIMSISISLSSQSLDSVLTEIKQNNYLLSSLEKKTEAEYLRKKSGIFLDDPQIAYSYLWGSPNDIGNQNEFEITQSFRFPTYYSSKRNVRENVYNQHIILKDKIKKEIMIEVSDTYYAIVMLKNKEKLLQNLSVETEKLVSVSKEGFEKGELSKISYNKVLILDINIRNKLKKIKSELRINYDKLKTMNADSGYAEFDFEYPSFYQMPVLDSLIERSIGTHSDILLANEITSEKGNFVKFQKSNRLPVFDIGYKSEYILDQKLQGVHAGLSIPLWSNKNVVKTAELEAEWSESNVLHAENKVVNEIRTLYEQLASTYEIFDELKKLTITDEIIGNNSELLKSGQISFPEYIYEMQFILDNQLYFLKTEYEFFKILKKLEILTED